MLNYNKYFVTVKRSNIKLLDLNNVRQVVDACALPHTASLPYLTVKDGVNSVLTL